MGVSVKYSVNHWFRGPVRVRCLLLFCNAFTRQLKLLTLHGDNRFDILEEINYTWVLESN